MTMEEFRASLREPVPPAGLAPLLKALWWDARGNFDRAHDIAQDTAQAESYPQEAAWVHAYLHRREGDQENAGYWYKRAHQPHPDNSSDDEWRQIATVLLHRDRS
jgi:tetratricopeptide (TPR) repeat protein